MTKKKILVIDDEKDFVEMFTMRLRASGFDVSAAVDGKAGLEKARRERPDLIIADIVLPGMDGIELCRTVKREAMFASVPVILLSGKDQRTTDGLKNLSIADAYFEKPAEDEALMSKIKELLKKAARGHE